jgi:hypothetical protein
MGYLFRERFVVEFHGLMIIGSMEYVANRRVMIG